MTAIRAPKKAVATCPFGDWIRVYWTEEGKSAPELRATDALRRHVRKVHKERIQIRVEAESVYGSVQDAQHLRPVQR